MELVAVSEVLSGIVRPLIGLGQKHAVPEVLVDVASEELEEGVGLGEVLAGRPLAFEEIRNRVHPEAVHPEVEPEVHDVQHRLLDGRAVIVEVRLV